MKRYFSGIFFLFVVFGLALQVSGQPKKKKKLRPPIVVQPDDPKHQPANAVKNLDVHPELQATLFASEKDGITNPVNLDIDHRGRVWVCDVMNYRGNNGKRPQGDRILILEDKDGDGKADDVKTFYQGRDVDSAMGICVLGNRVIVSATPNIFVFHFDENDKITKREVLFSKSGQPQHDHSLHSFVFGPDGRLYFNFGNTGHSMNDQNGKPIVDLAGNKVNDSGNPYRQGMIFRMDTPWLQRRAEVRQDPGPRGAHPSRWPDATKGPGAGVNFETLAWNFRNNYEVCVDSFGSMWQSDNDDDGNRGVRINFVMEYGNYGYVDEMTGAGWQTKRTNMEKEIPERHWHLNDPGVVPTLLLTGAGSPCGITVYEGTLLPKVFHGQMIHADAGPSVVRAYPVVKDGAGYKVTQTVNILDGNKKNNWFRPADVCVAPDGALFVTDWYDPGVGGHAQRDLDRGRIFRVAPPGNKPSVPKFDFTTAEGAVEALKSPNLAARYLAWTTINEMGAKAEKALLKAWKSKDGRLRARALWLLANIEEKGEHYVQQATADHDENIKIVGIRLTRSLNLDFIQTFRHLIGSKSLNNPVVSRECAVALRTVGNDRGEHFIWAALASQQPADRWHLEALGIGADKNWDQCLDAFLKVYAESINPKDELTRDIIWRSRAPKTPELLAQIIADKNTPGDQLPRMFRAFDFQKDSSVKNAALVKLAFSESSDAARQDFITAEALARIKSLDLKANPQYAEAVNKLLDRSKNTATFVEIVAKFNVGERYPELLHIAQQRPGEQIGVDAMRILLDRDAKLVQPGLMNKDVQVAAATVQAIGNAANPSANPLLLPIVEDRKADMELRRQATRALARTKPGALELIKLAKEKKLDEQLKFAAASGIATLPGDDVRRQAAGLFPFPTTKAELPIAPISILVKQKGNPAKGESIFAQTGQCANCHMVNGIGKEVGPNLSEIGKKLSKEALYESILYPSAGISHNFETWIAETTKGDIIQGVMISQTPAEVVLKDKDALLRTFKRKELDALVKSPISLMPADLHKSLTTQDLADVVEYMLTLREAKKK